MSSRSNRSVDQAEAQITELLETGKSISEAVNEWLQTDPQVIALLLLEGRIQHKVFAEYLLTVVQYLEAIVPAEELYGALGKQLTFNTEALIDVVLERHSSAFWLIDFFHKIEGSLFGYLHLLHKHRHPDRSKSRDIPAWCMQYAQKGARDGLIAFAKNTGNPIPAATLYGIGEPEAGLDAAVGAFTYSLKSPVLEFLAAKIGPDLDIIVEQIDERLDAADVERPLMVEWYLSSM